MASRRLQVSITRAELYVDLNPSRDGKREHTKVCINTVRHLGSDSTTDGAPHFTWMQTSEGIAKLVVFGSTSTDEYQVPCRVVDVTLKRQESIPKLLATTFRSDPVGAACDLAPCLRGFLNSTYDSWGLIIVKCLGDSASNPARFRLDIVAEMPCFALFDSTAKAFRKEHLCRPGVGGIWRRRFQYRKALRNACQCWRCVAAMYPVLFS
jgi:hypothetical protein